MARFVWEQPCGDSRPRLSAERSSAGFDSRAAWGVGLKIFENLERGDSKLGISSLERKASFARTADKKPEACQGLCGDSRPRLSTERSSAGFDSRAAWDVGLEIFENLERGHSRLGIALLERKASSARPDSRGRLSPQAD